MNREKASERPFRQLGSRLRAFREQQKQTLAEVSGAVEIDDTTLEQIELGQQRPSEDILLLFISYFDVKEEDAASLWELAGYTDAKSEPDQKTTFELNQPVAMLMPVDLRVVYSDTVNISTNKYGVVMNFLQSGGQGNQPLAISRIGMSKEHAQSVLSLLQQSLQPTTTNIKVLPPNTKPSTNKETQ